MAEQDQQPTPEKPPKAASTGVSPAADRAELAEGREAMRASLQRTGAALGAGATVLLTALGLTEAYELFPLPRNLSAEEQRGLFLVALLGAFAAVGGAAWLASRFFWAQRRILLDSKGLMEKPSRWKSWIADFRWTPAHERMTEHQLIEAVLDEHAHEQLAGNLRALEQRALRLERIARRRKAAGKPDDDVERVQSEADYLNGVVVIALSRAATVLLERRARNVFRGFWTGAALVLTIVGLVALFAVGDYARGERELVELRKACYEAKVPADACETVVAKPKSTTDADAKPPNVTLARKVINGWTEPPPRATRSARAARTAHLVQACQTVVRAGAPDLSEANAAAAVRLCVSTARGE